MLVSSLTASSLVFPSLKLVRYFLLSCPSVGWTNLLWEDFYVQIYGYGDLTQLNIAPGDFGGMLRICHSTPYDMI